MINDPSDITTFKGSATDLQQIITNALSSVFEAFNLGDIGRALSTFGVGALARFTGNDISWNSVISTNMSAGGLYAYNRQNQLLEMTKAVTDDMMATGLRNAAYAYERSIHSFKNWSAENGGGINAYDQFIQQRVQADVSKFGMQGLYNHLSNLGFIDQSAAVSSNMGLVAGTLAGGGWMRGDMNALRFGRAVAENLFTGAGYGDNGYGEYANIRYNRDAWGGFSQKAISELAASIAKDTDLIGTVDTTAPDQVHNAIMRFRDSVHAYAEALEPLRDVLGDEMQSMIQVLEQISGQSLGRLGAERISSISSRLTSRLENRQFSVAELQGTSNWFINAIERTPGLGEWGVRGATMQALDSLDLERGGTFRANYMSQAAYAQSARQLAFNTANSNGADLQAKAYAIWRWNREKGAAERLRTAVAEIAGGTPEDELTATQLSDIAEARRAIMDNEQQRNNFGVFHQEVMAMVDAGMDPSAAAMEVAQVNTPGELNAGVARAGYGDAIMSGQAAFAGREFYLRSRLRQMQWWSGMNQSFIIATGLSGNDNAGEEARAIAEDIRKAVTLSPDILNQNPEERARAIANLRDTEGGQLFSNDRAARMAAGLSVQMNDRRWRDVYTAVGQQQNYIDAFTRQASQEARNARVKAYGGALFRSGEGILQLFAEGWSDDNLHKMLVASNLIDAAGNDPDGMQALLSAAGSAATQIFGEDNAEGSSALVERVFRYGNSNEGLLNNSFMQAYSAYRQTQIDDVEGKKKYGIMMTAAMELGDTAMREFMESEIRDDNGNVITDREQAEQAKLNFLKQGLKSSRTPGGVALSEQVLQHTFNNRLANMSEASKALYKEFMSGDRDVNKDGITDLGEGWSSYYKIKTKELKGDQDKLAALNELNAGMRDTLSKEGVGPVQEKDIWGLLKTVLEKLDRTLSAREADPENQQGWTAAKNTGMTMRFQGVKYEVY